MNYSNYIFFWVEKKAYGYFSNFYPVKFSQNNITYNCSEQYFMKKKQELFDGNNIELGNKIMNETNPMNIKKYGRSVKNYDETQWNQHRYNIMKEALILKFSDPYLKNKLLETENKILVEASPYDNIWGIGLDEVSAKKIPPNQWKGSNLLGKALMEVRDFFLNQ